MGRVRGRNDPEGFNPHTHEGCDRKWAERQSEITAVSIHTPTKGVTSDTLSDNQVSKGFNPHTHEGCDLHDSNPTDKLKKFQSTHPRRV